MIEVSDIVKTYGKGGKVKALNGISFTVEDGEIFGVIGPDGAGKSSLFRILTSLILADSGTATLNGHDVVKDYKHIRNMIGYMPGKFSLYQDLTVEENLKFFATLFNTTIEENYHLIKDIYQQIEPFKNRRAGALSGGMKQKLALSCALIHKPEILILDEPTTGVDPVSRKEFWDMLGRLKEQNITIVVSTAYMDEAGRCDRIALIKDGVFIALDSPKGIIDSYDKKLWAVEGGKMSTLLKTLRGNESILSSFAFGNRIHITVDENLTTEDLKNYLQDKGFSEVAVYPVEPTVEDCFMALTS
ncbi:MAG: ABC transporter ATP-binding protein [Fermentimonas sp.]|jgi:ABC-2 type transport system ATP-binding protein